MGALNFNDTRARPGPCILKKFDLENLCKEVRVWYVGSLSDGLLQLFCSYSANLTHLFTKPESSGAVHRPLKIVGMFCSLWNWKKNCFSCVFFRFVYYRVDSLSLFTSDFSFECDFIDSTECIIVARGRITSWVPVLSCPVGNFCFLLMMIWSFC